MKRSEEREYNIRRVIHTAQMLFIADGISATPISRIAEAAGLTPTSLYRYFRNKDALVFAAWRDALATFLRTRGRHVQDRVREVCCLYAYLFQHLRCTAGMV